MKQALTILFAFLLSLNLLYGQKSGVAEWKKLSQDDSLALDNYWKEFYTAIEKKDTAKIRKMSLAEIDCDLCVTCNYKKYTPPDDYIISIDTFLLSNIHEIVKSALWKAIKKRGYRVGLEIIYDYHRKNLPKDYGQDLLLYEIWIQTYLPNEWAKGHEGQSQAFQFINYKNEFKFYGMTSIP